MKVITKIPLKRGQSRGGRCMNLTELQIQLRSIEEHIYDLREEIEKMKPQPEDEKKAMLEKITELASKYPLKGRRFPKISNVDVKTYISCLAYLSLADNSKIYDKLLFLCRLAHGMDLPIPSEDIFRMGLEIDEKYFDKACSELKSQKYTFLTDALILVNITEEAKEASFRVIADIARIFECEKEDIRIAAMVAKAVLLDDFNVLKQIPVPSKNRWMGQFRQHIPETWIKAQRVKCGSLCIEQYLPKNISSLADSIASILATSTQTEASGVEKYTKNSPCNVKRRLDDGTVVKKGEELVSYEESVKKKKQNSNPSYSFLFSASVLAASEINSETVIEKKSLTAPCDGVVFFIESNQKGAVSEHMDKFLEAYVVSYFDDYAEFCDWHKKK